MASADWLSSSPPGSCGHRKRVSDSSKKPVFSSRKRLPQRMAVGITGESTGVTLSSLAHSKGAINVSFRSLLTESELNIM